MDQEFISHKKKKPRVTETDQEEAALPIEVMMEIVSWLPLKPLARAQLVCKDWRSLIQEHQFMKKHMSRTMYRDYWYSENPMTSAPTTPEQVYCSHICDGLLLTRISTTSKQLVWNPALRLVLELPTFPQTVEHGDAIIFVPATKNYKLVSFYRDKNTREFGCLVLTLGLSMEWRPLKFPDLGNANPKISRFGCMVVEGDGVAHCIVFTTTNSDKKIDAEIVSLDVETESFMVSHRDNIGATIPMDCEGKLGFVVVDKREMQVMVLEDYKKKRWGSKNEVIPLHFLEDEGFIKGKKLVPWMIKEGEIWFLLEKEKVFVYTIETGKMRDVVELSLFNKLYTYKPSLVTVEGMRADDELKIYRSNLPLE